MFLLKHKTCFFFKFHNLCFYDYAETYTFSVYKISAKTYVWPLIAQLNSLSMTDGDNYYQKRLGPTAGPCTFTDAVGLEHTVQPSSEWDRRTGERIAALLYVLYRKGWRSKDEA